jgi:hypothetical protein
VDDKLDMLVVVDDENEGMLLVDDVRIEVAK